MEQSCATTSYKHFKRRHGNEVLAKYEKALKQRRIGGSSRTRPRLWPGELIGLPGSSHW
jgi:hypothetical protein